MFATSRVDGNEAGGEAVGEAVGEGGTDTLNSGTLTLNPKP